MTSSRSFILQLCIKIVRSSREFSIGLNVWQNSKFSRIKLSYVCYRFTLISFWRLLALCEAALAERWASTIHREYFKLSTSFIKIIILIFLFLIYNCFFIQFCTVLNKICDVCEKGMTPIYRVNIGTVVWLFELMMAWM